MPKHPDFIVYSLEFCPHCEELKDFLKKNNCKFSERDLSSAESLTELRVNGVFVNEAPVLQRGDDFFTSDDMFPEGRLDEKQIATIISGD